MPCTAESDAAAPAVAEPTASQPRFDVWEYQISGNTLLAPQDIERTVYGFLGPGRTIDDVEAARATLETLYRDRGYGTVLVDLPEQDVVDGVVRLTVVQGKVARLRVSGSRYFSLGRIRAYVPSLAAGSVPHLPQVQKELQRLNQASSDRVITPVLRPGKKPGTLEVELKVEDEFPLHASLELNDRYTLNTERLRLNAEVSYGNLWQREHAISAAYQVAPQNRDNVEVFSTTYSFRLPESDRMITLYGVKTASDVAAIGTLGVVGDGIIAGFRGTIPAPPIGSYYHSVSLGGDYKDFGESINLLGADSLNTPISYTSWSALYNGVYLGDHTQTEVSLGFTVGLRGLLNSKREFEDKRFLAKPNFAYVTGSLSHLQPLPFGFEIYGAANGQLADSPLISNEQFGMGGATSIRGYLESQQFVDDGVRLSLEMRSPNVAELLFYPLQNLHALAFVEGATGRIQKPLPGQRQTATLWSAGMGFRLLAFNDFEAEFDWAVPFKASGEIKRSESRVHFSVGYGF